MFIQVIPESAVVISTPRLSNVVGRLSELATTVHAAAKSKSLAASNLLLSLLPSKTIVQPPTIVEVPTLVEVPKYIMAPTKLVEPVRPSVAVVGPTMNVVYE